MPWDLWDKHRSPGKLGATAGQNGLSLYATKYCNAVLGIDDPWKNSASDLHDLIRKKRLYLQMRSESQPSKPMLSARCWQLPTNPPPDNQASYAMLGRHKF